MKPRLLNGCVGSTCPPHYYIIDEDRQGVCKWCGHKRDFAALQRRDRGYEKIFGSVRVAKTRVWGLERGVIGITASGKLF